MFAHNGVYRTNYIYYEPQCVCVCVCACGVTKNLLKCWLQLVMKCIHLATRVRASVTTNHGLGGHIRIHQIQKRKKNGKKLDQVQKYDVCIFEAFRATYFSCQDLKIKICKIDRVFKFESLLRVMQPNRNNLAVLKAEETRAKKKETPTIPVRTDLIFILDIMRAGTYTYDYVARYGARFAVFCVLTFVFSFCFSIENPRVIFIWPRVNELDQKCAFVLWCRLWCGCVV